MTASYCISVDAMGGDFGPRVTVSAACDALKRHPQLRIILVGRTDDLTPYLSRYRGKHLQRLELFHAQDIVSMEEKPSLALRNRRDSSMWKALQLVEEGRADACISAGNTGALMAMGRLVLGMLPGIERPAITAAIPSLKGHSFMLDLGANVDTSAEQLLQFAIMGSVMVETIENRPNPKVGLLNIGSEENKGTEQVREASKLIQEHGGINFIGYLEGDDLFSGRSDVVVCDGFAGNVALKSCEGLSKMLVRQVQGGFRRNLYRRLIALLATPILRDLKRQLDPGRLNGATLLGLRSVVIKSHGGANRVYFGHAIDQALVEARLNVPEKISDLVQRQTLRAQGQ
ncbi:phosphate acyltransferase PlsX [Marinobacterium mangrovicola]|uniref:Phosphate acyltransferase n=1 Tax=Marinobacterium mangrovicola TaxID=1476959 RepID=A0A4R1GP26_9GAMM|nr:phosphate acyltransferase PlsX [Marinobacterium mangrovicola]TCK09040.1 phosphate:acyl-[acyl carrier protein] acyltransferase [Marinobacterium mangrovicola]